MTLNIIIIIYILIIHWIADFGLQSRNQAQNKSHDFWILLGHVAQYACVLGMSIVIFTWDIIQWAEFLSINFIAHLITDYFTSKINARLWKQTDKHNFFVVVGLDQLIHQLTLILTVVYILVPGV